MKKNIKNIILLIISTAIGIFLLIMLLAHLGMIRFYYNEPEFDVGAQWYSDNPQIEIIVNSDKTISGKIKANNDYIDVDFFFKGDTAFFYYEEIGGFAITGKYTVAKNGNITVKSVKYSNELEFFDSDIEKFILVKEH